MQSDYILREIEKIGPLLLAMLGKMRMRKKGEEQQNEDCFAAWVRDIKDEASIDLETMLKTDKADMHKLFKYEKGFNDVNTELIADILVELSQYPGEHQAKEIRQKALEIYEYIDETYKSYSFDRMQKIASLK